MAELLIVNERGIGSNPVVPASSIHSSTAELRTFNAKVEGSNPSGYTRAIGCPVN